ncbi:hypothetical protein U9M48_004230, partial [Paspalum notatum var. saurae]
MWQSLIRNKYLQSKPLGSGTKKPGVSNFWAGIMEVKELFLSLGSFNIGDGTQVRFWEDNWCGNQPLKFSYPSLFNIATKKGTTVAEVMSSSPLNISFRRGLHGERLLAWNELIRRVMNLELSEGRDVFRWGLNKTGVFSVRSMYKHLINNGLKVSQEIWRTRIPLKTKIFMWYIKRGVLLTKDNLTRRNWYGGRKYKPLLLAGAAALIWAIWLQRNDCVFDRKQPKSFLRVLFRGTFWLRQWAKLQRNEDQDWLLLGAQRLETASLQVFNSFG